MISAVWLLPALPLAGFLILVVFSRWIREPLAGWLATIMVGTAFLAAVGVYLDLLSRPSEERL